MRKREVVELKVIMSSKMLKCAILKNKNVCDITACSLKVNAFLAESFKLDNTRLFIFYASCFNP